MLQRINLTARAPDQANEYVYFVALNRPFTEDPVTSSWVSPTLTPNLSNLLNMSNISFNLTKN